MADEILVDEVAPFDFAPWLSRQVYGLDFHRLPLCSDPDCWYCRLIGKKAAIASVGFEAGLIEFDWPRQTSLEEQQERACDYIVHHWRLRSPSDLLHPLTQLRAIGVSRSAYA